MVPSDRAGEIVLACHLTEMTTPWRQPLLRQVTYRDPFANAARTPRARSVLKEALSATSCGRAYLVDPRVAHSCLQARAVA